MDYTHLGRSGLSVSRLCLGTMNFGPETSEEDSHAIMDRALDAGINFFDTANVYGRGAAESFLGEVLGGVDRSSYVLATKAYFPMSDTDRGLSAVIRYTEYGVPHILAKDYANLGFGTGWAQAADQAPARAFLELQFFVANGSRHTNYFATTAATVWNDPKATILSVGSAAAMAADAGLQLPRWCMPCTHFSASGRSRCCGARR